MQFEGRRCLITGAGGFIAANLIPELLALGACVHAVARPGSNLWRLAGVREHITLHQLDITDAAALDRAVDAAQPAYVFHLAVGRNTATREGRLAVARTNVLGTLNLLEAAGPGCERFVYAGSSMEYGPRGQPTRETDLLIPKSFHGAIKAASTLLCQQAALANGWPIVMLRIYSVYGYWEAANRLVPTAILAALGDGKMALTESGYRRDLVFVQDVVDACLRAAVAEHASGEIINIGAGQQWSNEQVVETVEAVTGRRMDVKRGAYSPRPTDTTFWMADIDKARRMLDWEPRHSLKDGIAKMVDWLAPRRSDYEVMATAAVHGSAL